MHAFNHYLRSEKLEPYYQEYFKVLPGIFERYGNTYGSLFFNELGPKSDDDELYQLKYQQLMLESKNEVLKDLC